MTDHFLELHEEYSERMAAQAFGALLRRASCGRPTLHILSEPGQYCPRVAKALTTPAPWDQGCDKTSTFADR